MDVNNTISTLVLWKRRVLEDTMLLSREVINGIFRYDHGKTIRIK